MHTNEKLVKLRQKMTEENIDIYYVVTADPHMSEYVPPAYQARAWISGFTGSAGTAVITQDEAKLWTDGRYFIQAAKEIADTEFELMKLATPNYPTPLEYIKEKLAPEGTIAADGFTISEARVEQVGDMLREGQRLRLDLDLIGEIWDDRPAVPHSQAFLLSEAYSGRKTSEKLADLRQYLIDNKVDYALIGKLDDIAWLYNIRGRDVKSTPVLLSFALIGQTEAHLFIDETKLSAEIIQALADDGIEVSAYDDVKSRLSALENVCITLDKRYINASVFRAIPETLEIVNQADWTNYQKAIKNDVEINNQKKAYLKDGVALTKLMYWLKNDEQIDSYDELMVSETLLGLRQGLENFIEESFTTIAAYGDNAPMMHYAPTEENKTKLQKKSFLLVDSGGQYLEGTTDTTRTFALGELTEEEIKDYTLCLKAHISLASAVFLAGTTGHYLDALARQPLWKHRMDYKSGTGHGVGYLLSVHEGPHSISRGWINQPLAPNMVVTNEPGVYKEGKHGIRLENTYYVIEDELIDSDQFYRFENFTMVPFDRDAIDVDLLNREEIEWLDTFHAEVEQAISPFLTAAEQEWLTQACAAIGQNTRL